MKIQQIIDHLSMVGTPRRTMEELLKEKSRLMQAFQDGASRRDIYPLMLRVDQEICQLKKHAPTKPDTKTITVVQTQHAYVVETVTLKYEVPTDCDDLELWIEDNCDDNHLETESDKAYKDGTFVGSENVSRSFDWSDSVVEITDGSSS